MSTSAADLFWAHVDKTGTCWPWTGSKTKGGYGLYGGTTAHRYAWELANGPIPNGLYACHHCDVPACCRLDHLFLGTQKDNIADGIAKGRVVPGYWWVSISDEVISAVRAEYQLHSGSDRRQRAFSNRALALAWKYGISRTSVYRIVRGEQRTRFHTYATPSRDSQKKREQTRATARAMSSQQRQRPALVSGLEGGDRRHG